MGVQSNEIFDQNQATITAWVNSRLRSLDRARIRFGLNNEEVALKHQMILRALETFHLIDVSHPVLDRASEAFPVTLGTLDHAARALGFDVFGI